MLDWTFSDWVFAFLVVSVGSILVTCIVTATIGLLRDLKGHSSHLRTYVLFGLFLFPSMFSSCATINWLARDETHDAVGFEFPLYEKVLKSRATTVSVEEAPGGRSQVVIRRPSPNLPVAELVLVYLSSAHGIFSIVTALLVGAPFAWCLRRAGLERRLNGWQSFFLLQLSLAILFFVIYAATCVPLERIHE